MAGSAPFPVTQRDYLLLRNVSFQVFQWFMTVADEQGIPVALNRLRARFPREYPLPLHSASNGG